MNRAERRKEARKNPMKTQFNVIVDNPIPKNATFKIVGNPPRAVVTGEMK